jgi:hypothetical protein
MDSERLNGPDRAQFGDELYESYKIAPEMIGLRARAPG